MSAEDLSRVGIWLLVVGAVLIVLETAVAMWWTVRLSRRAAALSAYAAAQQAEIRGDMARLQASIVEMRELWRPYRRLLRLLRHPLTIALMQSFARRRARAA